MGYEYNDHEMKKMNQDQFLDVYTGKLVPILYCLNYNRV